MDEEVNEERIQENQKRESGLHNFAILSGREYIYICRFLRCGGMIRADSHARAAERSSNFEISGPAGLNVNTGIMLIAVVPSPLGHSSSTVVFWPLFAVRTALIPTVASRRPRVRRWSRKTRRI